MQRTADSRPMIRWAGSKRQLVPILLRYVPPHVRYIEPFAGSACLFFALQPGRAILGDINRELIETYEAVRDRPIDIARLLSRMPVESDFYYALRDRDVEAHDLVERAARFLYLNRFCFNGVYRTNRRGHFNVPRGVKTGTLPSIQDLIKWSRLFHNIRFIAGDFRESIRSINKGDFVYLDPPYSNAGARNRGEYGLEAFGAGDMPRLATALEDIDRAGATFLLSYRYSKAMNLKLSSWYRKAVLVRRHIAGFVSARATVREALFSNRPFKASAL